MTRLRDLFRRRPSDSAADRQPAQLDVGADTADEPDLSAQELLLAPAADTLALALADESSHPQALAQAAVDVAGTGTSPRYEALHAETLALQRAFEESCEQLLLAGRNTDRLALAHAELTLRAPQLDEPLQLIAQARDTHHQTARMAVARLRGMAQALEETGLRLERTALGPTPPASGVPASSRLEQALAALPATGAQLCQRLGLAQRQSGGLLTQLRRAGLAERGPDGVWRAVVREDAQVSAGRLADEAPEVEPTVSRPAAAGLSLTKAR